MILIADSGSTKCDWVILDKKWIEQTRINTVGFNPFFYDAKSITNALKEASTFDSIKDNVTKIYFFGAGCSSEKYCSIVENGLKKIFSKAKIIVEHDIKASALATYSGQPSITCINGTGSNACYFDGETVTSGNPSLGYLLGDEASGNYFAKKLLQAYFYKQLPQDLSKKLEQEYSVDHATLLKNIYEKPRANKYLASFFPFVAKHKNDPFFQKIIKEGFIEFFENQVAILVKENNCKEINFVGSVAFLLQDEVREVLKSLNLQAGVFVQKPIDEVINYLRKKEKKIY